MARIRTIKPEFFTSEQIVECSPSARLLFVGMWCFADDAGRHVASVKRLKMEVFPGDDFSTDDIAEMVEELLRAGLVIQYTVENATFWQVSGWKHQKIDRPTVRHPGPDKATKFDEPSPTPRRAIDEPSPPEGKGREGNGYINDHSANGPAYAKHFDKWWEHYPRKIGKKKAAAAYKQAARQVSHEALLDAVQSFAVSDKGRGEYCPHPTTWLNEGRYEDDPKAWQDRGKNTGGGETPEQRQRRLEKTRKLLEAARGQA